tara:strand:- start:3684 stop:5624 length:1941 start_codon:yes stop_codon:yes gene_type:complete
MYYDPNKSVIEKDKFQLFIYSNLPLLISSRYILEDGLTKTFIKNVISLELLLLLLLLPNLIKTREGLYSEIKYLLSLFREKLNISIVYFVFVIGMSLNFLFNSEGAIYFGKLVFIIGMSILSFQIFSLYILIGQKKLSITLSNVQRNLFKPIGYTAITLIPILRFCIVNNGILSIREQLLIILYFLLLSFFIIGVVSFLFDETTKSLIFQPFSTALLCIVYEMPSLSQNYPFVRGSNNYSLLIFFFGLFVFFRLIYKSKPLQMSLLVIGLLAAGTLPSVIFDEEIDYDLEKIQALSPFKFSNETSLANNYSVVVLVYDGYPPEETVNLLGGDISQQTNFLIENDFTIYNGVYSMGSYSLATMSRFLQGTEQEYGEDDMRKITGGSSSFVKTLDQYGYHTAGIFTSVFYFPPNSKPEYDYSFPNKGGKRSKRMFDAILKGRLTMEDILYTIPYENYLIEKQNFLKNINTREVPSFLYTHTYYPGHSQNSGTCLENETAEWINRLEFANDEMRSDVSYLSPAFDNTIIVIMGDHGPFLTKNCTGLTEYEEGEISRLDIQDRHGTFLAVRWPDSSNTIEFEEKILQNVLISIFSTLISDGGFMKENELNEKIYVTHLPEGISVEKNIIYGGINNLEPLFLDREIRKSSK